ncbi:MAG TPA: sugar phosphate nucleotidyltransferase [Polyangiaceae bacterium]
MILGAGLGTRLRPLTDHVPKALMPLGDAPILVSLANELRAAGLGPIVVNAHHHASVLDAFVKASLPFVQVSTETDLLGTAGGVAHAKRLLGEGDVVIWNGDIVAPIDLRALVAAHERERAKATLMVKLAPRGEGNVGVDTDGRIVRLRKETTAPGEVSGGAFLGIHVLGPELRDALPETGCLVGDVYLPALRRGDVLRVHRFTGIFGDIGTPSAYWIACLAWLGDQGGRFYTGKNVQIATEVEIVESIVGEGAIVEGTGELHRVVVWPGARAKAPLDNAVVTPAGVTKIRL